MDLRARLRKIHGRAGRPSRRRPNKRPEQRPGGRRTDRPEERLPVALSVEQSSDQGVRLRTTRFALSASHGDLPLAGIARVDQSLLGRAAGLDLELDPHQAVFFDTETTGLGGGAGVYVFLVGLLTVEQSAIRVDQILLADLGAESAFLDRVAAAFESCSSLVSFVGKSFDRHRLDDRFAMHLRGRPLGELPHCDLYYLARRLYGHGLENTRLRTVEESLLGVHRRDDLDGSECPEAYYDFLDGARHDLIDRVLKHNLIDLLSLVTLTVLVDRDLRTPGGAAQAAGAGLLLLSVGDTERALCHLEQAVTGIDETTGRVDRGVRRSTLELARLYRRSGRSREALELVERLARALPDDSQALLVAAKIAEHDLRDRGRALLLARQLHSRVLSSPGGRKRAELLDQTNQRIVRLES